MYIREKPNKSGSRSVLIVDKSIGKYKVVKTIGCSKSEEGLLLLRHQAQQELDSLRRQMSLFVSDEDAMIESYLDTISNSNVRVIGTELVFGKIYDYIGFNQIEEDLFGHLVISRLVFSLSKLKTVDYLNRYLGIRVEVSTIYRFLDKLNNQLKE